MMMTMLTLNNCLLVHVLQGAAAAAASSRQSFIDEYFGGEYETTYLFVKE